MSYPSVIEMGEDALFAFTNKKEARLARVPLEKLCPRRADAPRRPGRPEMKGRAP